MHYRSWVIFVVFSFFFSSCYGQMGQNEESSPLRITANFSLNFTDKKENSLFHKYGISLPGFHTGISLSKDYRIRNNVFVQIGVGFDYTQFDIIDETITNTSPFIGERSSTITDTHTRMLESRLPVILKKSFHKNISFGVGGLVSYRIADFSHTDVESLELYGPITIINPSTGTSTTINGVLNPPRSSEFNSSTDVPAKKLQLGMIGQVNYSIPGQIFSKNIDVGLQALRFLTDYDLNEGHDLSWKIGLSLSIDL